MGNKHQLRFMIKLRAKRIFYANFVLCAMAALLGMAVTTLGNVLASKFLPDIRILETTTDLMPYLPNLVRYYALLAVITLLIRPYMMGQFAWLSELSMGRRKKLREIFVWMGDLRLLGKALSANLRFAWIMIWNLVLYLWLPALLFFFVLSRAETMGMQAVVFLAGLIGLISIVGVILALLHAYASLPALYLLAAHPEMRVRDAFRECRQFMEGRRGEFLILVLSFLGWFYVESVSYGLLSLYVQPYYHLTLVTFTQQARASWLIQRGKPLDDPAWTPEENPEEEDDQNV